MAHAEQAEAVLGMSRMTRLGAVLAAVVLAVFGTVAPASAATYPSVYGCPNDSSVGGALCLYQWGVYNSSGGVWKRSMAALANSYDANVHGCTNLNQELWDGTNATVYDTASSLILNTSKSVNGTGSVTFYEWTNCNGGGRWFECDVPIGAPVVYGLQTFLSIPVTSQTSQRCRTPFASNNFQDTIASIHYDPSA